MMRQDPAIAPTKFILITKLIAVEFVNIHVYMY